MADRRREHLRHVQCRLTTGSRQPLGDDSEQRPGMSIGNRDLNPSRHDRTTAARRCASGRATRDEVHDRTCRDARGSARRPSPPQQPGDRCGYRRAPAPWLERRARTWSRSDSSSIARTTTATTDRRSPRPAETPSWRRRGCVGHHAQRRPPDRSAARPTPVRDAVAIGRTAPARSMVTLTVPGLRRVPGADDEPMILAISASSIVSATSMDCTGCASRRCGGWGRFIEEQTDERHGAQPVGQGMVGS